eukprot:TRINITY_DN16631_c0_g1_i1.p1 TRINITY_DN16631_c0_g1~~TRINITY_DN16631_c0_g1_i1.p1  ORF type:complete len:332 (+),score=71.86 TRINITY_DN16631_c0_g1_i1:57-998(+)
MDNLSNKKASVLVSNLTLNTTASSLTEFFSFCGSIASIDITAVSVEEAQAIITFSNESASKTALLLHNALINDRPITVTLYDSNNVSPSSVSNNSISPIPPVNTKDDVPLYPNLEPEVNNYVTPTPNKPPSIFASVLASAWALGQAAATKIKQVDEKYNITQNIKKGTDAVSEKLKNFESEHNLSKKAQDMVATVQEKFKAVDAKYSISSKASSTARILNDGAIAATSKINSGLSNVTNTVNEKVENNETYAKNLQKLKGAAASVSLSVKNVKDETQALINEKKQALPNNVQLPEEEVPLFKEEESKPNFTSN